MTKCTFIHPRITGFVFERSIYLFVFIFICFNALGQTVKTHPKMKEVTVFLNRAQIESTASVKLSNSTREVIMEGLPNSIDPQSVQVSGKGNFMIMAVKYEDNFLNSLEKSPEVLSLEDSLKFFRFQLSTFQDFEAVMHKEEQMLIANQAIGGKEKSLDADDLEYFANFFRKRLLDIRFQILKNKQDIQSLDDKIARLKKQIAVLGQKKQSSGRIIVKIASKVQTPAQFNLSYVVNNAGWYPVYNIRVKDSDSLAVLGYKANVYQNTGLDWEHVNLKLSTNNPSLGGMKPELSPNYLTVYSPPSYNGRYLSASKRMGAAPRMENAEGEKEKQDALTIAAVTHTVKTSLAVEFVINTPYTIPSAGKGQVVDIKNIELPAMYKYYTVPKLSDAAYLVGIISDYDDKDLISGNASVYFEGTYVGETFLDMNTTQDTLRVSLGRDNNIVVERKALKEFRSKSFLGINRKETFAYEVSVRNGKQSPIEITLEDQVPVSQNEEIEVGVINLGGAVKEDATGKLTWKLSIGAAETKKVDFKYEVKYPKNKQISGLR